MVLEYFVPGMIFYGSYFRKVGFLIYQHFPSLMGEKCEFELPGLDRRASKTGIISIHCLIFRAINDGLLLTFEVWSMIDRTRYGIELFRQQSQTTSCTYKIGGKR